MKKFPEVNNVIYNLQSHAPLPAPVRTACVQMQMPKRQTLRQQHSLNKYSICQ